MPPYEQDKPPIITIDGIPRFQSGQIDESEITSTSTAYVTLGTKLQITGNAYNPVGGVKTFSITIKKGDNIIYSVKTVSSPDTNNKVPIQLVILGNDGATGPGGNPIVIDMTETGIGLAKVTAIAENYNGMQTSLEITYIRLGPITFRFNAIPNSIESGQHSTLSWEVNG